ncbi:MAG: PolC-type DNA polymerase III [Burkholderiales bacterium]
MNWLTRLLHPAPPLDTAHARAIAAWRALPEPDLTQPLHGLRYVVVDVESSGLNPFRDKLISIGAVAIIDGVIRFDHGFDAVLRQETPSDHSNILVHGIGGTAQTNGRHAADVLVDFLGFAGKAPLIGFHAEFDKVMMKRAMRNALRLDLPNVWLDVAILAQALFAERASAAHSLDEWLREFGIDNHARHEAVADALATAQLFQIMIAQAMCTGIKSCAELIRLEKAHHKWGVHRFRGS